MKKLKKILIISLLSLTLIGNIDVYAKTITKDSSEYKECKKTCDKQKNNPNQSGYNACMSTCNGMLTKKTTSKDLQKAKKEADAKSAAQKANLNFCSSTAVIWQIVGWVFLVVKILIPILLIIFGVLDVSKCIFASKDDDLPKAMKKLMFRAISAIVIFFIPTIVGLVMGLIINFADSGAKADYEVCKTCILNPKSCDTSKDAGKQ